MDIITILTVLIGILIFVILILVLVYVYMMQPKKKKKEEESILYSQAEIQEETEEKKVENFGRFQGNLTQDSIFQFMEFDEVVDNMIVRKKKNQYIMILQCNGVNYDLMSEQEKMGVEQGFVQFLNTLRFPIQLYVQSRTLNLKEIIDGYKKRISTLKNDIEKLNVKIIQARRENNRPQREKLEFEKRRKESVLDYGLDITDYIERLNSNKNILQQRTYVVVSFFVNELGGNLENYSKEEIINMCFSELYTRCQNVSSALASSGVTSKILTSEELVELLYIAYNRDEAETYQFEKALEAQYDALYSTGKDILQKKQEKLDQEINIEAIDLATASILSADRQKKVEDLERAKNKSDRVKEMASQILDEYEDQLNPRVYEIAKEKVENSDPSSDDPLAPKKVAKSENKTVAKKTASSVVSRKKVASKGTATTVKKRKTED